MPQQWSEKWAFLQTTWATWKLVFSKRLVHVINQISYGFRRIPSYHLIHFSQPLKISTKKGSRVGAVARPLVFHHCVLGSIPGPGAICGLSLLVLYSAPRGFSPGTPAFPSPQKATFALIWFELICLIYSYLIWFTWLTVSPISTRVLERLET